MTPPPNREPRWAAGRETTQAARRLGSFVHQIAPTKTLSHEQAIQLEALIRDVEAEAAALDPERLAAALALAVDRERRRAALAFGTALSDADIPPEVAMRIIDATLRGAATPDEESTEQEDQELGAAWRRCEAIPGWALREVMRRSVKGPQDYAAIGLPVRADGTWIHSKSLNGFGPTPTAALNDLADKIAAISRGAD